MPHAQRSLCSGHPRCNGAPSYTHHGSAWERWDDARLVHILASGVFSRDFRTPGTPSIMSDNRHIPSATGTISPDRTFTKANVSKGQMTFVHRSETALDAPSHHAGEQHPSPLVPPVLLGVHTKTGTATRYDARTRMNAATPTPHDPRRDGTFHADSLDPLSVFRIGHGKREVSSGPEKIGGRSFGVLGMMGAGWWAERFRVGGSKKIGGRQ